MSIPVIDIGPAFLEGAFSKPYSPALLEMVKQVDDASKKWGFFNAINHNIDYQLIDKVEKGSKEFFAQDTEVKRKAQKNSPASGRGFFDNELTKNILDWKQGFDYGLWPGDFDCECLWPNMPQGWKETMEEYYRATENLAKVFTKIYAVAMEKPPEYFLDSFLDTKHASFVRLNYYPLTNTNKQVLGVNPHQDGSAITILKQDDDVSGLQVYTGTAEEFKADVTDEEWITVEPVKGALVVNVGMMMEVWSNMRYKAALHRVLANTTKTRYSAPFFLLPSGDTTVSPVLLESDPKAKYRDIQFGEFRRLLFEGFQKAIPLDKQARLPNYRI